MLKYSDDMKWVKYGTESKIWCKIGNKRAKTGDVIFSFDRIHEFSLLRDYPERLTEEQREIFAKEYPQIAESFGGKKIEA